MHIVPKGGMVMLVATEGEVRTGCNDDDDNVFLKTDNMKTGGSEKNVGINEEDDDDGVQQARGARRHSGEMESNNQSVPGSPLR